MSLKSTQQAQLNAYGTATFTGTPAYLLAVDSSGNIIEEVLGGGGGDPDQFLWETVVGDTGSTAANTITDTLTIAGGTDITTAMSGDTLTVNYTGSHPAAVNIYNTNGTLTGNRTLTGGTNFLRFDFDDGAGDVSFLDLQDSIMTQSLTDGTNTHSVVLSSSQLKLTSADSIVTHNLTMSPVSTILTLKSTSASTFDYGAFISAANGSLVTSEIRCFDNATGVTAEYAVKLAGSVFTTYFKTQAIIDTTASAGDVPTLAGTGDGSWEWATPVTGDVDQNLWATFSSDSGSTVANSITDTISIVGAGTISTAIAGDILTITGTDADTYLGNTDQTLGAARDIDLATFTLTASESGTDVISWSNTELFALITNTGDETGTWTRNADFRIGWWDSAHASATTFNLLKATNTQIGLFTDDTTNDTYVVLDNTNDDVEIKSTQATDISTITVDGPSITIDSTNGGGSYSRIITNGTTDNLYLSVYDGTDTNLLDINHINTDSSSAWSDSGIITASMTTSQNNWSPTDLDKSRIIRVTLSADSVLTGLVATTAVDGQVVELWNTSALYEFVMSHDTTSTIANRFYLPSNSSVTVKENGCIILRYDFTSSRWRVISHI